MTKRRTRKQKVAAVHNFEVSWKPEAKKEGVEASVNRQNKLQDSSLIKTSSSKDKSINTVNNKDVAIIKKDLIKSLMVASLILGIETVLYLIWY